MSIDNVQRALQEKVVLVTGAAQGIGREVARVAADQGAKLVLVDRAEQVTQVAQELPAETQVHTTLADLETWEGAESAVKFALEQFDRVDVCINAVGGTI